MSLINAAADAVRTKLASAASISYLVTLIEERTTNPVSADQFESFSQVTVSDMIEQALLKPALPATPEQLALVAELALKLGRGTLVTKDRGQASRQIRSMQADLDAKANAVRVTTPERAATANALLDSLIGDEPEVAAPVETDEIPF